MEMLCRHLRFLSLFLVAVTTARTSRSDEPLSFLFEDEITGRSMAYRLYLPPDFDSEGRYPLVLFLHGVGECGTDNATQIRFHVQNLVAATQSERFASFLVAPQAPCCDDCGIWGGERVDLVSGVLTKVEGDYPQIDIRRIYVTGLSAGGFGVFRQLEDYPGRFAAAVPLSSGFVNPVRAAQVAPNIVHIPIWVFHGALDQTVPVSYSDVIVAELRRAGGQPRYTVYPDLGHNIWSLTYADEEDELYPWLFSQVLPARFRRGDCNRDGAVDISDAIFVLWSSFLGEGEYSCRDACDSDDDGTVDLSDAIATLGVLFLGQGNIPAPGPADCGADPTFDAMGCKAYSGCP